VKNAEIHRRGRRARRLAALACVSITASVMTACSSSTSSRPATSSSGAPSASVSSGGSSSDLMTSSRNISAASAGGLVFSNTEDPTDPSQIQPYGSWRGPTSAPTPKAHARVEVIVCTKGSSPCTNTAAGIQAAGKVLGWDVDVIDGGASVLGYGQAFDTAFSRNPQAIVGVAVSTSLVGDKLAEAKRKGIITVATADNKPPAGQTAYDAYVDFPATLMQVLLAYEEIARTDGHANTILLTDPAVTTVAVAADAYARVMKDCSGCTVQRGNYPVANVSNSATVTAEILGALSKDPNATALDIPFSDGIAAVSQAVQSTGRDVKIIVGGGDVAGLSAVVNGSAFADGGASTTWLGWACADAVVRGLAGSPYLTGAAAGLGTTVVTAANAPKNANIDSLNGMPDFVAQYKKIWGKG
jgi:ribose transport system substrate-binding protein